MSRLINYGVGDIADRLSILALKVLHYSAAGKDVSYLMKERNALLTQWRTKELPLNGPFGEAWLELGAVNAALWATEDALRAYRLHNEAYDLESEELRVHPETVKALRLAFRIQELNDRRAQLIDQINQATGEFLGPEKG